MSGIVQIGGVALASHDSGTDKVSLDSGTVFPTGHVLQVLQTINTELEEVTGNATANTYADIPGMAITIVTTGSNKVLVTANLHLGNADAGGAVWWRFGRETDSGSVNDAFCIGTEPLTSQSSATARENIRATNATQMSSMTFLDSPGAGSHVYKTRWQAESGGSSTGYLNRAGGVSEQPYFSSLVSTITVMEISV